MQTDCESLGLTIGLYGVYVLNVFSNETQIHLGV